MTDPSVEQAPSALEGDGLRPQLETFADEVGDIEPLEAGDLEGVRATYVLETGGQQVNGVQFYVEVDDEVSIITVSARDADDAQDVADTIEDSLVLAG